MTIIKGLLGKATVASAMALSLTLSLCILALNGTIPGETFLAAVVGGAFAWAFGGKQSAK